MAAQAELMRGAESMLDRTLRMENELPNEDCTLLATLPALRKSVLRNIPAPEHPSGDAYFLRTVESNSHSILLVAGANDRGVLFGVFDLLRKIGLHQQIDLLDEEHAPSVPIRWTNEWDNLNGTIKRGYAGRSIFFEAGNVVPDMKRAAEYARWPPWESTAARLIT